MRVLSVFAACLLLSSIFRADADGSIFFINGSKHQYLRTRSSTDVPEAFHLSPTEVAAAVSVMLGFAPPATLTADGSSKLNKILKPNPFERPRTVLMLDVPGVDDRFVKGFDSHILLSNAMNSVIPGSDSADLHFPDESEVSVVSLDEAFSSLTEKDISDFASWLGGSYTTAPLEPLTGLLSIPLGNGAKVDFYLAKKAERQFARSLLILSQNIKRVADLNVDSVLAVERTAELMTGCFNGIKALQEDYGVEGMAKQGMEVLLATLSKLFDLLETSHKGEIVGVIVFVGRANVDSQKLINVVYSRPSPRWLAEKEGASNATLIAEVVLVRRTLAWLTGIILLIATLLGVYFLMNMPLTKDTLLYSNVKLD